MVESRSSGEKLVRSMKKLYTALAGPACLNTNAPLRRGRTYVLTGPCLGDEAGVDDSIGEAIKAACI